MSVKRIIKYIGQNKKDIIFSKTYVLLFIILWQSLINYFFIWINKTFCIHISIFAYKKLRIYYEMHALDLLWYTCIRSFAYLHTSIYTYLHTYIYTYLHTYVYRQNLMIHICIFGNAHTQNSILAFYVWSICSSLHPYICVLFTWIYFSRYTIVLLYSSLSFFKDG